MKEIYGSILSESATNIPHYEVITPFLPVALLVLIG